MNNRVKILFIDDQAITEVAGSIVRKLASCTPTSYHAEYEHMNIGHQDFKDFDPVTKEFTLNLGRVKDHLTSHYMNMRFDVVACDFNYKDKKCNGYHVLRHLINFSKSQGLPIKKAFFVLYSSEKIDDKLRDEDLPNLINLRVGHFFERDDLDNKLPPLIKRLKEVTPSLFVHIIDRLESQHDMGLSNSYPYPHFRNKTLAEIAREIDLETHHGIEFAKFVVDMAMDNVLEIDR